MMIAAVVKTNHRSRPLLPACFLIFALGFYCCSCNAQENEHNSIVRFFKNAECQFETDDQRQEIEQALSDMLHKTPAQIKGTRYADYAGKRVWSAPELLKGYFVPRPMMALDNDRFYKDMLAPTAQKAIQSQLDMLIKD